MAQTITAFGKHVVVVPDRADETLHNGIVLPEQARREPNQGIVLSASNEALLSNGDRVVYSAYAGTAVTINGEELVILKVEEILAKLDS